MTSLANTVVLPLFAVLGALLGLVQLQGLRSNVAHYLRLGARPWIVGLHALRLVLVAAAFVAIARLGAGVVLAVFGGWLITRTLLLAQLRRRP